MTALHKTLIIGVDCATDPCNVGVARGWLQAEQLRVDEVLCGSRSATAADVVHDLIGSSCPVLLALDAPLGWPKELGTSLSAHAAGGSLEPAADLLFRRETDRFIRRETGKQSLDVGADRIARTAHAALALLAELRNRLRLPIPLCWNANDLRDVEAIEVYPAATLKQLGVSAAAYKKKDQAQARHRILDAIETLANLSAVRNKAADNSNALDAVICAISGADFLRGACYAPEDRSIAEREGWIWVMR